MSDLEALQRTAREAERQFRVAQDAVACAAADLRQREIAYHEALQAYADGVEQACSGTAYLGAATGEPSTHTWQEPGPDFEQVVLDSGSRSHEVRLGARRKLDRMGPLAVEPLLALLRRESRRRRSRFRMALAYLLLFVFIGAIDVAEPGLVPIPAVLVVVIACLVLGSVPFALQGAKQRLATAALARIDDRRVVGALLDALDGDAAGDLVSRSMAVEALRRHLPSLRPADARMLTDSQLRALRGLLLSQDSALVIDVLRAMERIGGSEALGDVERLAEGDGVAGMDGRVRDAAKSCLAALVDRSEVDRDMRRLLRPVSAPGQTTLVRPAFRPPSPDEDPALLLRPSENPRASEPDRGSEGEVTGQET